MVSILRLKMVHPSNSFIAQTVGGAFFGKVERCDYLPASARLPHISRNGPKTRRPDSHYRHFSESMSLLAESSHFAKMELDRLPSLSRTSMTQYQNIKQSRQMVATSDEKGYQLPKQSSITTRILFQTIAPHMEFRTLTQLTNRLSKIELDQRDRAGKEQALEKMLNELFENIERTKLDNLTSIKYAPSIKAHSWIQPIIHSYFMGKKLDVPNQEGAEQSYQKDPTYPPNRNSHQHQKNLNILIEARKVSLRHCVTVERGTNDSERQIYLDAEGMLEKLSSNLPLSHFRNLMEKLRGFTTLHDKIQKNDPRSWLIDDNCTPLPDRNEVNDEKACETVQKENTRILCNALTISSPTHCHFVADAFAEYFHFDISKTQSAHMNEKKNRKVIAKYTKSDSNARMEATDLVKYQKEIDMMEKKYDRKKDKFVKEIMGLQHIFASWGENPVAKEDGAQNHHHSSTIETVSIEQDSDNDGAFDLSVKEFKKEQEPYDPITRMEQKMQLKETLEELHKLGLEKEKESANNKKGKGRGRPQKGNHIRFTAIRMEEEELSSQSIMEEKDANDDKIVFLNNLPIDTSEDEIDSIYSRCGQLESIQLFNLRPDLDPGPLTTVQMKEQIRMKKLMRKKNTYAAQGRPRTPVYAMLRFITDAGYQMATSQELCIFGCVIRRHPVLSIKSHDVNTLYLEQIPPHLFSIDVENRLGELLYPHKFSLMLDGTQGLGLDGSIKNSDANYQEYSRPSSCQIRFADHRAAAQAYQWIREDGKKFFKNSSNGVDEINGSLEVHWFQTPSNSMDYWTRDLSF